MAVTRTESGSTGGFKYYEIGAGRRGKVAADADQRSLVKWGVLTFALLLLLSTVFTIAKYDLISASTTMYIPSMTSGGSRQRLLRKRQVGGGGGSGSLSSSTTTVPTIASTSTTMTTTISIISTTTTTQVPSTTTTILTTTTSTSLITSSSSVTKTSISTTISSITATNNIAIVILPTGSNPSSTPTATSQSSSTSSSGLSSSGIAGICVAVGGLFIAGKELGVYFSIAIWLFRKFSVSPRDRFRAKLEPPPLQNTPSKDNPFVSKSSAAPTNNNTIGGVGTGGSVRKGPLPYIGSAVKFTSLNRKTTRMTTTTGGSEDAPQENGSRSGSPVRMQYSTPISPSANYGTTSSPQQQLQASMTYNSLPVQYGYIMSGLSPQQQQQLQQQLILQSSPPRHASPEHNNNTMMNSNNYNNDNNSSISSPVSQNYVAFVDHQQRPPPIQPFQYNVHSPQAPASGTFIGVDSHQQPLSNSQRLHVVNGVARTSLDSYRSSAHESAPTQNNVNNNEGIPMN